MTLNVDSFFDQDGLIASVKKNFKPREGQPDLSKTILKAMRMSMHVLAEAPTGFGKSFAVLVPSIIEAIENGKRIVISTETLTLQDQYLEKDLPLLVEALKPLGIDLRFAAAKGRNNYICKTKLDDEHTSAGTPLTKWATLQSVPQSGDIASTDIEFNLADWRKIGADDDCEKRGCPYYQDGAEVGGQTQCFVYQARRNMMEAQIVVTNHTMFLLDAQNDIGSVLGPYDYAIIDEAHSLAEKAQDVWGSAFKTHTLFRHIASMDKALQRIGLGSFFSKGDYDAAKLYEEDVFKPLWDVKDTVMFNKLSDEKQDAIHDALDAAIMFLKDVNDRMKKMLRDDESPRDMVINVNLEKTRKLIGTLKTVTGKNLDPDFKDNWLSFVQAEWNGKRKEWNRSINLKPIIVAPLINTRILQPLTSVTFMSATMRVNNSFVFIRSEFGLAKDDALEFTGDSPFDFFEQVRMYMPKHLPDAKDERYLPALTDEIVRLIKHTEGKTLVLFTNMGHMRTVHEAVSGKVKYECFVQGQAPRGTLIDLFSEDTHSCLFATRSFFTGVDIPGEALSSVILTKAPFRVPSDPMFKAKCDKIEEDGRNSFGELSLPLMLFDVRQAFGRLIRTTTDTGIFALLDSRALNSGYSGKIINSLPNTRKLKLSP